MCSLGIVLLDALIFNDGIYYYSDDVYVLYQVAVRSLMATPWLVVRPLQYLIVLAANYVYLPLWLAASLLCVVGATIMSALACERLFERRLAKAGWWVLGAANPLFFYLVSQPDIVSQALCNLFFAGALLAFISEFCRIGGQAPCRRHGESAAVFLNLMCAALFFTKETAIAAALVFPTATTLIRLRAARLSPTFLLSLLLPIAAGVGWMWLNVKYGSLLQPGADGARYGLTLSPLLWIKNLTITLAFPITPLPSSFLAFELLRSLWIAAALASILLFMIFILYRIKLDPTIFFPLLIVLVSCLPMIWVRTDELYPSMIGPFLVSIALLFGVPTLRWLSVAYGLLLYGASLGNAVIYCLGADFNLFGLQHSEYSIYGKWYQFDPICPIATTAHVGWDPHPPIKVVYAYRPDIKGRITCVR
jgi:hypothetical protein